MDRVYVIQLVESYRQGQLTRRAFLRNATLAVGSLATAQMLLAACTPRVETPVPESGPEVTSTEGLITAIVDYPGADGEALMGYLARPDDATVHPAVVVIQEWWGLNDHIRDVVRRLAREGFVALAPDLYHGVVVSEPDEAQKLVMELDMDEAVTEIRHAIAFLRDQTFVGSERVGVMGFCMGGGLTLQTARVEEAVGAAVAFYGSPLSPTEVGTVQAAVLGLYAEEDRGLPVSRVRAMEQALNDARIPNEIHIYPGAEHAFFNDTRASYHPGAAADAWQRTLAWFREWL